SVMARPGGVFCTHFDLQNLSYTNTGGVCGVAPITSLYALRRPENFRPFAAILGRRNRFLMSGDRIGLAGLFLRYVALRDVLRGDYVGRFVHLFFCCGRFFRGG
ncbi:TPA: hypothetical protein ACHJ4D_005186, partial [Escherichia coli]